MDKVKDKKLGGRVRRDDRRINVTLPEYLIAQLEQIAKDKHLDRAALIRLILIESVESGNTDLVG